MYQNKVSLCIKETLIYKQFTNVVLILTNSGSGYLHSRPGLAVNLLCMRPRVHQIISLDCRILICPISEFSIKLSIKDILILKNIGCCNSVMILGHWEGKVSCVHVIYFLRRPGYVKYILKDFLKCL